jgi:hypothetical protein
MAQSAPGSYAAECYWPGVTQAELTATLDRAEAASVELRRKGGDVALQGAILLATDETVFCLFNGQEVDVRAASELAGVPFERILQTHWFQPSALADA